MTRVDHGGVSVSIRVSMQNTNKRSLRSNSPKKISASSRSHHKYATHPILDVQKTCSNPAAHPAFVVASLQAGSWVYLGRAPHPACPDFRRIAVPASGSDFSHAVIRFSHAVIPTFPPRHPDLPTLSSRPEWPAPAGHAAEGSRLDLNRIKIDLTALRRPVVLGLFFSATLRVLCGTSATSPAATLTLSSRPEWAAFARRERCPRS